VRVRQAQYAIDLTRGVQTVAQNWVPEGTKRDKLIITKKKKIIYFDEKRKKEKGKRKKKKLKRK
jgi:hypothetical protein